MNFEKTAHKQMRIYKVTVTTNERTITDHIEAETKISAIIKSSTKNKISFEKSTCVEAETILAVSDIIK